MGTYALNMYNGRMNADIILDSATVGDNLLLCKVSVLNVKISH